MTSDRRAVANDRMSVAAIKAKTSAERANHKVFIRYFFFYYF